MNGSELEVWGIAIGLLGGLALFLFGMEMMTDALKVVAGDRMRTILGKLTTNRWTASMTGAFVTAVMWTLIYERVSYFRGDHRKEVARIHAIWSDWEDDASWEARQVRRMLISEVRLKLERGLPLIQTIVAVCPMFGLLGTVTGMIEVCLDITLRKRAELRNKTFFETMQDGFWILDSQGCIVEVNDAYADMVGYSAEELVGKRAHELEANETALPEIKDGAAGMEVDQIARDIIENAGYGESFIHGLGHGVGLEIHEPPSLSKRSKDTLRVGNVVSNEPGIYVKGFGGVRIEDTVLVTSSGPECLTKFDRDLDAMRV